MPTVAPKSKAEFYRRYKTGEFGNRLRQWNSLDELERSGYRGLVTARCLTRTGKFHFNVPYDDMMKLPVQTGYIFTHSCPDDKMTIQGHITRTQVGITLEYNLKPGISNREAMTANDGRTIAMDSVALAILRHYMDPASYDNVIEFINEYDSDLDMTVEFSTFSVPVGDIPGRNTIIWEVRDY